MVPHLTSREPESINLGVPVEGYATIHRQGSSNTALEVGGWGDVVIAADTNSVASKNIIFSKQERKILFGDYAHRFQQQRWYCERRSRI